MSERDHVTDCLKGVIHEPLFEKAIFQTANPNDSCDEGNNPVVDSLQVELQGLAGRPPGESQLANDLKFAALIEVSFASCASRA